MQYSPHIVSLTICYRLLKHLYWVSYKISHCFSNNTGD